MPKPSTLHSLQKAAALPGNDRRQRRRFSAEDKRRIVAEPQRCERGELAALLRREGIYHSHLAQWRAAREAAGLAGLAPKKSERKPSKDDKDRAIERLEREKVRLERELRRYLKAGDAFRCLDRLRAREVSSSEGEVAPTRSHVNSDGEDNGQISYLHTGSQPCA